MEMKLGQATSSQVSSAQNQHYAAEDEIMRHVKSMSLVGKQKLANKMPQHVKDAEAEAKG